MLKMLKIMTLSIVLCHMMALDRSRGFSLQNGCIAVISIDTGKVFDVEALQNPVSSVNSILTLIRTVWSSSC